MAKTPGTVLNFLDHLLEVAKPAAERDLKAVTDFAAAEGADLPIQPWDFSYWSETLK